MAAVAALIAGACMSFSGNGHDACTKAAEAGAKQSGFEQNIDQVEKDVTKKADKTVHLFLGDTAVDVLGGGIFVAKTVRDKSLQLNLPTLGICDKISGEVGTERSGIQFIWKLP